MGELRSQYRNVAGECQMVVGSLNRVVRVVREGQRALYLDLKGLLAWLRYSVAGL